MKSNVIPFLFAKNVSPSADGLIIAESLHEAIKDFGARNLALSIVEANSMHQKQAA